MKKAILIATCVASLSAFTTVGALAQSSTGPAAQQDTISREKMMKNGMKKDGMAKDSMSKGLDVQGRDNEEGRHEQVSCAVPAIRGRPSRRLFRWRETRWNEP
jgi:pentapeptide MXKDX repeat protein